MKNKLKAPCDECPWRRKHVPGWLGGYPPEQFVDQIQWDGPPLPCHKTISAATVANDPEMTSASICYGSLVFMKNSCKSAYHPGYGDALDHVEPDRENIFQWPHEFIQHHTQSIEDWFRKRKDDQP